MGHKDDIVGPESVDFKFFPDSKSIIFQKRMQRRRSLSIFRARAFHDDQVIDYPKNTHLMREHPESTTCPLISTLLIKGFITCRRHTSKKALYQV